MAQPIRIGLVSDTHGWLDPALLAHFAAVDHIVHAGDVGTAEVLDALAAVAPVTAVRGNVDGGRLADLPLVTTFGAGGRRVAALHIAGSPKRPNRDALRILRQDRPDVLVVGHSHIPVVARVEGALWINPGAAGRQGLHERRTAALLEIPPDGELRLFRIELGPRGRRPGER
jgi:putative phosphoesterase